MQSEYNYLNSDKQSPDLKNNEFNIRINNAFFLTNEKCNN